MIINPFPIQIGLTKQGSFFIMCHQDAPVNDNEIWYSIYDKDGATILEAESVEAALLSYQVWASLRASDDGEHHAWSEEIEIVGCVDGDPVTKSRWLAHMDSRIDSYDHGRSFYESTRL